MAPQNLLLVCADKPFLKEKDQFSLPTPCVRDPTHLLEAAGSVA